MATPQIIALGGGGFSMDLENPLLDHYVLAQTAADHPKICFIGTASGDSERYLLNFYTTFTGLGCRPSHIPFFSRTPDLHRTVMEQDILYVGGGNTKSMLAVWREYGFNDILREAWQAGVILAGISAGAICWFEQGLTDSSAEGIQPLDGLGILPGTCSPHYDGEPERRPMFHHLLASGQVKSGIALDDFAAAHYKGTELFQVIASRPQARGYRVEVTPDGPQETELETHLLIGAS